MVLWWWLAFVLTVGLFVGSRFAERGSFAPTGELSGLAAEDLVVLAALALALVAWTIWCAWRFATLPGWKAPWRGGAIVALVVLTVASLTGPTMRPGWQALPAAVLVLAGWYQAYVASRIAQRSPGAREANIAFLSALAMWAMVALLIAAAMAGQRSLGQEAEALIGLMSDGITGATVFLVPVSLILHVTFGRRAGDAPVEE